MEMIDRDLPIVPSYLSDPLTLLRIRPPSPGDKWISLDVAEQRIASLAPPALNALIARVEHGDHPDTPYNEAMIEMGRQRGTLIRSLMRACLATEELIGGVQQYNGSFSQIRSDVWRLVGPCSFQPKLTMASGLFNCIEAAFPPNALEREAQHRPVCILQSSLDQVCRSIKLPNGVLPKVARKIVNEFKERYPGKFLLKKQFTNELRARLPCRDDVVDSLWGDCADQDWKRGGRRPDSQIVSDPWRRRCGL